MTTLTFDTLAYARLLTDAGFSRQQAEALTQAQMLAGKYLLAERDLAGRDLATREDLLSLKKEMLLLEARTNDRLNELRFSLVKWIIGSMLGISGVIIAAVAVTVTILK